MKKISILVCTYNGEDLIRDCLDSILNQSYKNFEILCIDGISFDNTLDIIKEYMKKDRRIKLLINKKRLPEGHGNGKWLGFRKARGDIIGIVDQDNVLQENKLFEKAVKGLNNDKKLLGVLGGLKHDIRDDSIVRYISLTGTDSFMAYRAIDFIQNIKKSQNSIQMQTDNMFLTGGNCFFYRKKDLKDIGGYDQDVFGIKKLIESGKNKLMIIGGATKHYAEENFSKLIKKKFHWGGKYFENSGKKFDYFPRTALERNAFLKNIFFNLLFIPNWYYSIRLYNGSRDLVSFLFPYIAFLNTLAYGLNFMKSKLS